MMNKRILSLYVNLGESDLNIPDYLNKDKGIIHICPLSIKGKTFSEQGIEKVKDLLGRGWLLGQRGYTGRCKYPHNDETDPWHENFCLYNPGLSLEEQIDLMVKGKEILIKVFGIAPIYSPINHLRDENTLKAAQVLKYKCMMDQNNFGINPYKNHGIIIIPESKIGDEETEQSLGIYAHHHTLKEKGVEEFIKRFELVLPNEIKLDKPLQNILTLNEIQKRIKKLERDKQTLKK